MGKHSPKVPKKTGSKHKGGKGTKTGGGWNLPKGHCSGHSSYTVGCANCKAAASAETERDKL